MYSTQVIITTVMVFYKTLMLDSRFISLNVHKAAGPLYNYNILLLHTYVTYTKKHIIFMKFASQTFDALF